MGAHHGHRQSMAQSSRHGLRWQHLALGLATLTSVGGAGGVGYALATDTSSTAGTISVAPVAAAPLVAVSAAPARPLARGPKLVDEDGRALDEALGGRVAEVYSALDADNLEAVRQAYSHTGSDDWITSSSHLKSATVRSKLQAALRTAPVHAASGSYRYRAAGYTITFGTSDSSAPPGLVSIKGPWTASSTSSASSTSPTSASKASSSAAKSSSASKSGKASTPAICDLSGPPVFGDPDHPNVITNRACGYTDTSGRARSKDPWIDGQLADAGH